MPSALRPLLSSTLRQSTWSTKPSTTALAPAINVCQRRLKSSNAGGAPNGVREGTGKVGYDKYRPVDRRAGRVEPQQSMVVAQKEAMRKSMPNDLGLLLGTLIMPSNLPSLISEPRERLSMEWKRALKRVKEFASLIYYSWTQRPRLKIHFRKTASTAQALHRQMYTALAEGDTATIASISTEGLRSHLLSRISSRPRHATYTWTLHSYPSAPRVVSNRCTRLPIDDGSGSKPMLRQAVVRIKSLQSLTRTDTRASKEEREGKMMEVDEFVVVQRRVWRGVEERWRIWGTTRETRVEDFERVVNEEEPEGTAGAEAGRGEVMKGGSASLG